MRHVYRLLAECKADNTTGVMVIYFLLCPEDETKLPVKWKMPKGWDMGRRCGGVFCAPIPASGTVCMKTVNA